MGLFSFVLDTYRGMENKKIEIAMIRARILGKMDYFYFLRHVYETCL
jgi:hypothetical protein